MRLVWSHRVCGSVAPRPCCALWLLCFAMFLQPVVVRCERLRLGFPSAAEASRLAPRILTGKMPFLFEVREGHSIDLGSLESGRLLKS